MKSFEHFLSQLAIIPDPRRAEGKLYQLPHVLLFSIFAIVSGKWGAMFFDTEEQAQKMNAAMTGFTKMVQRMDPRDRDQLLAEMKEHYVHFLPEHMR